MVAQPRRRLLMLACVLTGAFVPALASASTGFYAGTRVRGLDLGNTLDSAGEIIDSLLPYLP